MQNKLEWLFIKWFFSYNFFITQDGNNNCNEYVRSHTTIIYVHPNANQRKYEKGTISFQKCISKHEANQVGRWNDR